MSVWPGRLGRLVHALIKTFSVYPRQQLLASCLASATPGYHQSFVACRFGNFNTQMRVAFVWRHAWKDPS